MKEQIKFSSRVYLRKGTNAVQVRVRWNNKKNEVDTFIGIYAEPAKWDSELQKARRATTHKVGNHDSKTAREINRTIEDFLSIVDDIFTDFSLKGIIPNNTEFRHALNAYIAPKPELAEESAQDQDKTSLDKAFKEFMEIRPTEVGWGKSSHHKYNQMLTYLKAINKNVQLDKIDKKYLNSVKMDLINKGYHNATIAKQFRNIRGFLKWSKLNGYSINEEALAFKANIQSHQKRVIFLHFSELIHFQQFSFPESKQYLSRARDLFCFMAFTSLRYSDLCMLKKSDVKEDCLEIYTEKTDDMLSIPLTSHAKALLEKYKDKVPGDYVFHVPSNQKLNDYIKEAAELAGLDREVSEVYYCGKIKHETVNKLYETLSCHDARRTFVCCSLAFGITPTTVMSCTGHADYKAMQPYIDVADETARKEIKKWDIQSNKSKVVEFIDQLSDEQLNKALTLLKQEFKIA